MRLVALLALRDLLRDRVQLVCNAAVLAGVLVPLLVLYGVKNGVYDALIGRLMANPATLQIDTVGNNAFSDADAEEVRSWDQAGFVTLKTRSLFDFVNIATADRGKRDALLVPSGAGDPTLPAGVTLADGQIVVSDALARQLELSQGDTVRLVTQAEDRPRQLVLPVEIAAILPAGTAGGRMALADIAVLDLVEAFYDGYALPDHGIDAGRPLADRQADYEGMRVYARDLRDLAALQSQIEGRFGIRTEARTREVESVLGLGRNLDLALALTVSVAALGLAAALAFGFWGAVARKRTAMASLAMMGLAGSRLSVFPLVQAIVSALAGLAVSFGLFGLAAVTATQLFGGGPGGAPLVRLSLAEGLAIALAVLVFVTASALAAARAATRADPASVLREAG